MCSLLVLAEQAFCRRQVEGALGCKEGHLLKKSSEYLKALTTDHSFIHSGVVEASCICFRPWAMHRLFLTFWKVTIPQIHLVNFTLQHLASLMSSVPPDMPSWHH